MPRLLFPCVLLSLFACTSVEVVEQYQGAPLPRPDRILVHAFVYSPDQVKLVPRVFPGLEPSPASALASQRRQVGHEVSRVLSERLVAELRDMGLPAEPASAGPTAGKVYSIEGEFLSIDLGDLTQRAETGIGRTEVRTRVQLYGPADEGKPLLETLEATASGAGANTLGLDVEADASRTASQVAKQLRAFFAQQGWVSP